MAFSYTLKRFPMIRTFYAMAFAACVGIALLNPAEQKPKAEAPQLTAQQRYEITRRLRQNQKDFEACMAIRKTNSMVRCSTN